MAIVYVKGQPEQIVFSNYKLLDILLEYRQVNLQS